MFETNFSEIFFVVELHRNAGIPLMQNISMRQGTRYYDANNSTKLVEIFLKVFYTGFLGS